MQRKCQKERARPRTSLDEDTRVSSMERQLGGTDRHLLDARGKEHGNGSSTGLKLSRSCPKLVDIDKTSTDVETGDDVWSKKNGNLKSHPLKNVEKKTKHKKRGLSIVKFFNVLTLGMKSMIVKILTNTSIVEVLGQLFAILRGEGEF